MYVENNELTEIIIRYGYRQFDYASMRRDFTWFQFVIPRLFFMAYKYKTYDSKLIDDEIGYQYNFQLGPERAQKVLDCENISNWIFLVKCS